MSSEVIEADRITEKWFRTHHLKNDLKVLSVKGGVSTVSGQAANFVLNTASNVVLARLLLPQDYGLVAMVSVVTGFASIFKDFGLTAAIIQKEDINQRQVNAVFWINVLISLAIALLVAMSAPLLVRFYQEERLLLITLAFAFSIFISGLSLQHYALMRRQMLFKTVALFQTANTAASLLTGITLAWLGFGYWALVASSIQSSLFSTTAVWLACDWRPTLPIRTSNVKSFLTFGAGVTGFDLINYFSRNMDNVVIGRFIGTVALGLYTKAYQLMTLPLGQLMGPLGSVAVPALSALQNDREKYQSFFRKYLFILCFFYMPLVIYLAVFADELVFIVLGENWAEAGNIFKILAISAFIQPVASSQGIVLKTTGKIKRYFYVGLINAIFMVSGFFIGIRWGVAGVAMSQAVVVYSLFLPLLYFSFRGGPISVPLFLKEIASPLAFSLTSGAAMLLVKAQAYSMSLDFHIGSYSLSAVIPCAIGLVVGAAVYLTLWSIFPTTRQKFLQILEIGSFLKKGKAGR